MPLHCVELLLMRGQKCTFLDTGSKFSPFVAKRLNKVGVPVLKVSPANLNSIFSDIYPALVLSVSNLLIFPQEIISQPNLEIFNYHNSLLPLHRGVNAEAWTIYDGDKTAGVTWHKVEGNIDAGRILAQKEFPISEDITSGQLLKRQASEALSLLDWSLGSLLKGNYVLCPQRQGTPSCHKKSESPNNNLLSAEWKIEKIWRFLRAYDYGISCNLGLPVIKIKGKLFSWRRYFKSQPSRSASVTFPRNYNIGSISLEDLYPVDFNAFKPKI